MNTHKIGILSDTHDLLRPEVLEQLKGCEVILHGGDISSRAILDKLGEIAPVFAVRGNNDKEWAENLPSALDTNICGLHLFMTHKKKELPKDLSSFDLVVYGHSHKYEEVRENGTILLNPGSCGPRRFNQEITLAVLTVSEKSAISNIEKIVIPHTGAPLKTADLKKSDIEKIIKLIQKGRSFPQIAQTMHLEEAVAEQVCRLYSTHPGVDAEGIMKKMDI